MEGFQRQQQRLARQTKLLKRAAHCLSLAGRLIILTCLTCLHVLAGGQAQGFQGSLPSCDGNSVGVFPWCKWSMMCTGVRALCVCTETHTLERRKSFGNAGAV